MEHGRRIDVQNYGQIFPLSVYMGMFPQACLHELCADFALKNTLGISVKRSSTVITKVQKLYHNVCMFYQML